MAYSYVKVKVKVKVCLTKQSESLPLTHMNVLFTRMTYMLYLAY